MDYKQKSMENYRDTARHLFNQSYKYEINETEKKTLKNLREQKNNNAIFLTVQSTDIAVEELDSKKIIIHDLKNNKSYKTSWHDNTIGMPVIAVFVPHVDILYLSGLIKIF